jgi:hypothetical protein
MANNKSLFTESGIVTFDVLRTYLSVRTDIKIIQTSVYSSMNKSIMCIFFIKTIDDKISLTQFDCVSNTICTNNECSFSWKAGVDNYNLEWYIVPIQDYFYSSINEFIDISPFPQGMKDLLSN